MTPHRKRRSTRKALLWAGACALVAQEAPPDLESLLSVRVVSATRTQQRASESPAIVAVVTRREIQQRGARSVAEAIRDLPGLYAVDDRFMEDIGIRGVRGGVRGANRIFKVMVDYQPVAFRFDGTVSLGPDFIPIDAVERIEVLRGPASAVYGANAFLGVVHIITRAAGPGTRSSLTLRAERGSGRTGPGAEGLLAWSTGAWGLLAAASNHNLDRSDLALPESSPIRHSGVPRDTQSRFDTADPSSFFLKVTHRRKDTLVTDLTGHFSRLSNHAEWLDFGTLTHKNKLSQENGYLRVHSTWTPAEGFSLQGSAAYSEGKNDPSERLNTGSTISYLRRDIGYRSTDLAVEAQWQGGSTFWGVAGVDHTRDDQKLLDLYQVPLAGGAPQLVFPSQGRMAFSNLGVFAQAGIHVWPDLELTLNGRRDEHNLFGVNHTFRIGLVRTAASGVQAKLLYGSSYKAPTPLQLYSRPIYPGDLVGNAELRPETAQTLEAELGWEILGGLTVKLDGFRNWIFNKIDLQPINTNMKPLNRDQVVSTGVEAQIQWTFGALEGAFSLTLQNTEELQRLPLLGEVRVPSSAFPRSSGNTRVGYTFENGLRLEGQLRYAGPRRSNPSNDFENHFQPYTLPAYLLADLGLVYPMEWARWSLRVRNLTGTRYAEAGSRGYDLPGSPRELVLACNLRF